VALFEAYFSGSDAKLNLFFENAGDSYAIFFVYFFHDVQGFVDHSRLVAPGSSATLQLELEHLVPRPVQAGMIALDGNDLAGEFALRMTHLPLPN